MKQKITFLTIVLLFAVMLSCKKTDNMTGKAQTTTSTSAPIDSVIAPMGFNFSTTKTVSLNISFAANNNDPIAGIPVNIYQGDPTVSSPILTAITNSQGILQAQVNVPAYIDTLVIDAKYIGLIRNAKAVISNNNITAKIGGPDGYTGNIIETNYAEHRGMGMRSLSLMKNMASANTHTVYNYMGQYDNSGVPQYLVSPPGVVTAQLLSFLNTSLPETVDVRKLHPQYLQSSATADIIITQTADVWVTFVSEGAGYLNSVGFYTYPTNNPPKSPTDIDTVNYIFPNASLPGSGGNLKSGSKVKLGRFNAGTSIGFTLLANAWNSGTHKVNSNATEFYSTTACNPEADPNLKKHTVLLYSTDPDLFLVGFDDQDRQTGGSDNDFNDVVFYTTSNPVTAISTTNVEPIDKPVDSDGDGVTDTFDQFPNDPTRAYISYYPSQTTFGTLLFEDLWPATGDYDMNDMVVGYRYKTVTNAQNLAVEIYADYMVEASGASYVSGFGVQFPFSASKVKTVTGQKLVGGYIKQNANGTEASQTNAVIIPFDSYKAVIQRPGGYYINTQNGAPYITGDTVHVYMSFTNPISASTLGNAPFNPFLISNQRRGYEVHLANTLPTDLADKKLFGTLQDNTNPAMGNYYLSKKSWPWALNFAGPFDYSAEGISIGKSYNYFLQWAQSGGTVHQDWYLNNPGNRNESMIYKK